MVTNALIGIANREDVVGAKSFVRSIAISIMNETCFYKLDVRSLAHAAQAVAVVPSAQMSSGGGGS